MRISIQTDPRSNSGKSQRLEQPEGISLARRIAPSQPIKEKRANEVRADFRGSLSEVPS
jgi:hypothetical protein